jgi:sugar lactone lactonase YvrE
MKAPFSSRAQNSTHVRAARPAAEKPPRQPVGSIARLGPAELLLDLRLDRGSECTWNPLSKKLRFADAGERIIYEYDPVSHALRQFIAPATITALIPRASGGMVVGTVNGLFSLRTDPYRLSYLVVPCDREQFTGSFLCCTCDSAGSLWLGTSHPQAGRGSGSLYCIPAGGVPRKAVLVDLACDNLAWDRTGQVLYCVHSSIRQVMAYRIDPESGRLAQRRTVLTIPAGSDLPRGVTLDAEGKLWIAHWQGGRVSRWDPATGSCLAEISVPVPGVTGCEFGGEDLGTLYISTARCGLNQVELDARPRSGGIFSCRPGVRGIPGNCSAA